MLAPQSPDGPALEDDLRSKPTLSQWLEDRLFKQLAYSEYRERVRDVYDGPRGAILTIFSRLSLHIALGERLFRERKFDLRGVRRILDVGSGAGQIAGHLLRHADPEAEILCCDLSQKMLRRAAQRLKSNRPRFVVADLARLPFPDGAFDCVTCGYVLEHLPDPRMGLAELTRVMAPGARMLLLTTEENFTGACVSRFWHCRTYRRADLAQTCEELGLQWRRELWYTRLHEIFRAGGICVELHKPAVALRGPGSSKWPARVRCRQ